jgi:hypothetical protein
VTLGGGVAAAVAALTAAPAAVAAPASGVAACPPRDPRAGPGAVDPFRAPEARATALNAAAKILYRQGQWDQARAQYRAAEAADPEFLAPALNVACSFVRQERFVEATTEVLRLLDRAYIPWSREILTAADLGALKTQPQMAQVQQALADGARRWGAGLDSDLLFVARQREPLKLPPTQEATGPVVLVLGLHQEVFAWSPATNRYRQITVEDGRVVALAQSIDRRRILYVTADKLVRRPGAAATLRGVALHALALPTLTAGAPVVLEGDLSRLAIVPLGAGFALDLEGDKLRGGFTLDGDGGTGLVPGRRPDQKRAAAAGRLVVLTSGGVAAGGKRWFDGRRDGTRAAADPGNGGACLLLARASRTPEGRATIEVARARPGGDRDDATLVLRPRFGAALNGLTIP